MGRRMRLTRGARVSLLVFASIIPFASSARNAWVWDDHLLLTSRLAPDQCSGFGDIWRQPYWGPRLPPDTYRPLSLSFIYAEKRAFGERVLPYRAVTLAMHTITVLLLAALIGTLAGEPLAFAAALLFAVHPVHAEAVDMVYGQLELLATALSLLAAWFYVKARRGGLRPAPFAAALVCAALAAC
jgi:protein O-mannosyl-transferase